MSSVVIVQLTQVWCREMVASCQQCRKARCPLNPDPSDPTLTYTVCEGWCVVVHLSCSVVCWRPEVIFLAARPPHRPGFPSIFTLGTRQAILHQARDPPKFWSPIQRLTCFFKAFFLP